MNVYGWKMRPSRDIRAFGDRFDSAVGARRKKGTYYTFIRDTAAARRNTFAVYMHIS